MRRFGRPLAHLVFGIRGLGGPFPESLATLPVWSGSINIDARYAACANMPLSPTFMRLASILLLALLAFTGASSAAVPSRGVEALWPITAGHDAHQPWNDDILGDSTLDAEGETPPWLEEEPPVDRTFRLAHPLCHSNVTDTPLVTNDWLYARSTLRGYDPETGQPTWKTPSVSYYRVGGFSPTVPLLTSGIFYKAPWRIGLPDPKFPQAPENSRLSSDANGDGVCDVMSYGLTPRVVIRGVHVNFTGELVLYSGQDGKALWKVPIGADRYDVLACNEEYHLTGFPTGLHAFDSSSGPKFVLKTTDITYHYDCNTNWSLWIVQEHIRLGDGRTGQAYWQRSILHVTQGPMPQTEPVMTWITGAKDTDGDGESEIILDEYHTPTELRARALSGALEGSGEDLWADTPIYTPPYRGLLSFSEEVQETFLFHHAQVLDDVTGDGHPDVLGLYETVVDGGTEGGTINGLYRVHLALIDGRTGQRMWGDRDIKFQGWGFGASLATPQAPSNARLAFATVDLPTGDIPGSRFPLKEVRVMVIKSEDGSPEWTYVSKVPEDSMSNFNQVLHQYVDALAPVDVDGDGQLDPVTPARWDQPKGTHQTLLFNSKHTYQSLDADTGRPLQTYEVWGPTGRLVRGDDGEQATLRFLSGITRRYDVTSLDARTGERIERIPIYNNPTPQAQVSGIQTLYSHIAFGDPESPRLIMGTSFAQSSLRRGFEVLTPRAAFGNETQESWLVPALRGRAVTEAVVPLEIPEEDIGIGAGGALIVGSAIPGIAIGLVASGLWSRWRTAKEASS
jgi:hypothetical protein